VSSNKIAILLACLSLVVAFFVNELNLYHIKKEAPEKVRLGETIETADDLSYLVPAKNFIEKGEWKDNSIGKVSYFLRPPGYGLIFLPFYALFGFEGALVFLKIIQLLLFSLSVFCFYKICEHVISNKILSILTTSIYGIFPIAMGFVYYTLSESLTPALVIFYTYGLVTAYHHDNIKLKYRNYLLASIVLAFLIIVRPVLIVLGIALPIFLFFDLRQKVVNLKMIITFFKYGLISLSLLLIWEIRVYSKAEKFPGLHPIYYEDFNSIYRPTHKHIWKFAKCWGIRSDRFHSLIGPIWYNAIHDDRLDDSHINTFIESIPKDMVEEIGRNKIFDAFKLYQKSALFQKEFYQKNLPMPKISVLENDAVEAFRQLTKTYKKNHILKYHIAIPLKYFKDMVLHSNLSLHIFQFTFRGNFLMELLRYVSLAIHTSVFVLFFFTIFIRTNMALKLIFLFIPIVYIFLLCYFVRELEERYTLPILPLLIIASGIVISHATNIKTK